MKQLMFKKIMKINGFYYSWKMYTRDDWYAISIEDWEYTLLDATWDFDDAKNKAELIWKLALHWIINRLF